MKVLSIITMSLKTRDIFMNPCLFKMLVSHSLCALVLMENLTTAPDCDVLLHIYLKNKCELEYSCPHS